MKIFETQYHTYSSLGWNHL